MDENSELDKMIGLIDAGYHNGEYSPYSLVYFFLLQEPRTSRDLSKLIYNGKIQVGHINEVISKFLRLGIVEQVAYSKEELRQLGKSPVSRCYRATFLPFIRKCELALMERNEKSTMMRKFTVEDKEALKKILESDWFKPFFSQEYLLYEVGREVEQYKKNKTLLISPTPLTYLGFIIPYLGAIRFEFQSVSHILRESTVREINYAKSFDEVIEKNERWIRQNEKTKKFVDCVFTFENDGNKLNESIHAGLLVEEGLFYKSFLSTTRAAFKNYGVLAIPASLADKFTCVDWNPLSVMLAYGNTIAELRNSRRIKLWNGTILRPPKI